MIPELDSSFITCGYEAQFIKANQLTIFRSLNERNSLSAESQEAKTEEFLTPIPCPPSKSNNDKVAPQAFCKVPREDLRNGHLLNIS